MARVERLNWLADRSEHGWAGSLGLMVNYLYELDAIEANHEAYAADGRSPRPPAGEKRRRVTVKAAMASRDELPRGLGDSDVPAGTVGRKRALLFFGSIVAAT